MPFRHQAVQACHASIEAASAGLIPTGNTNLVLLTDSSKESLIATSIRLRGAGIAHRVFQEDDRGGEVTALATEPINGESRQLFANYALLKG